jgi:hypothetical protein
MKKKIPGILICMLLFSSWLLVLVAEETRAEDWWDTGWSYRKLITIDSSMVNSDLTNFLVLIYTSSDSDLASHAQNDGDDIFFVDQNNITKYDHEIEKYDGSTGELVAWVEIPSLSSTTDTSLYMYYGNPDCGNQQNVAGTWDSSYKIVQHLNESSGTLYDSTSNDNDGTNNGPATYNDSAKIDGGYDFDGDEDYIEVAHSTSLNFVDAITIEGWFYLSTLRQYNPLVRKGVSLPADINEDGIVNDEDNDLLLDHWEESSLPPYPRWDVNGDGVTNQADLGMVLNSYEETSPLWFIQIVENKTIFSMSGTSNPQLSSVKTFTNADTGKWYHFAVAYDGSSSFIYLNGVLDNSTSNTGSIDTTSIALKIASDTYRYYFDGTIDEIRISNTTRSASWISSSYNNQYSPGTFLDFGDEEYLEEYLSQLVISTSTSVIEKETFDVTVTADEVAIKDVSVVFNNEEKITDADGTVSFIAPEVATNQEYTITAILEGYVKDTETITVLNQIEQRGWIYGVVTDDLDSFLKDAQVCTMISDEGTTSKCTPTNEEGEYVLSIPIGTYTVEASKDGYETDIKYSIEVNDRQAVEMNFVLQEIPDYEPESQDLNEQFIEAKIDAEITNKNVGGKIEVADDSSNIITYNDELDLEIMPKTQPEEVITFRVEAGEGTPGQVIVVRIQDILEEISVKIDGAEITEITDLETLFNPDNQNSVYAKVTTIDKSYVLVYIGSFSEHTITISMIVEALGGITGVLLYFAFFAVAGIIFATVVVVFLVRFVYSKKH